MTLPTGRNPAPSPGAVLVRLLLLLVGVNLALSGCGGPPIKRKEGGSSARPYTLANIAKSDVDLVSELAQREALQSLRRLTDKLYRRNPDEFRKAGLDTRDKAVARIFSQIPIWAKSGLARSDWEESLRLAFAESYSGDRVHVLMSALTTMVMAAFNHRTEFYMTDELDAQKLYNSARNLEVAAWKLSHARMANGKLFLLSNSMNGDDQNLSFEREFGRLIGGQDLLAMVVEDQSNRSITRVIHNVASFVFLPI